ncbi:hypothetical protein B1A_18602, partial [mine drainage metagenome]
EPERRFHSLYDKIQRMDVLERAWESVMKNGGSPGIDGITIKELKEKRNRTTVNRNTVRTESKNIQTITTEEGIHTKGKREETSIEHTHSKGQDNTDSH